MLCAARLWRKAMQQKRWYGRALMPAMRRTIWLSVTRNPRGSVQSWWWNRHTKQDSWSTARISGVKNWSKGAAFCSQIGCNTTMGAICFRPSWSRMCRWNEHCTRMSNTSERSPLCVLMNVIKLFRYGSTK
uniref:Uncharacterized protein n=1 Tax=Spironucleus salmonicida TaxID=348837 RepID=V6LPD3_9EUKA|eukprot:EST42584.1 Hypothetical protein SS50377_17903 [Spironucleus salmonicida]